MVKTFFWLATVITVLFLLAMIILFICNWVIYYRIEETETHGPIKKELTHVTDDILNLPPKKVSGQRLKELWVKSENDQ